MWVSGPAPDLLTWAAVEFLWRRGKASAPWLEEDAGGMNLVKAPEAEIAEIFFFCIDSVSF